MQPNTQNTGPSVQVLTLIIFVMSLALIWLLLDKFAPQIVSDRSPLTTITGANNKRDEIQALIDRYYIDDTSEVDFREGEIKGYVGALDDEYSEYLSEDEWREFEESLNESYVGIGIRFTNKIEGFVVEEVIPGSPALEAGLEAGDIIFKVEGENASEIPFEEIAQKIKGEAGTVVNITILRDSQEIDVPITRRAIEIEQLTVVYEDDIAIITISSFGENLTSTMSGIVDEVEDRGIENVILDVRSNGGGLLTEAVSVSSFFLSPGETVLKEKSVDGNKTYQAIEKPNTFDDDIEVVVLQNRFSASASEIVAGALKDQRGATIVGEKSFGKGVVQRIFELQNEGVLKLTIAEWFTPDGSVINERGLLPDVPVGPDQDALELAKDQF